MPKTVLVVDDDQALRQCFADILAQEGGFTVQIAKNGAEALELIDTGLAFDVLLTDRHMPVMGGEELIARLRSRGLRQFAILASGDVRLPAEVPGADLVIGKPVRIFDLIEIIKCAEPRQA